jgi:hypothetical protein
MTLDDIFKRTVEVGECREWTGSFTTSGVPLVYHRGQRTTVRKVVYEIRTGKQLPVGMVASTKCTNPRCVDHVLPLTKAQMLERSRANTNQELRAAKIAASKRRTAAKLTPEQVQMIRDSKETSTALALRLGVHHSVPAGIRKGLMWKEFTTPFSGLGAR